LWSDRTISDISDLKGGDASETEGGVTVNFFKHYHLFATTREKKDFRRLNPAMVRFEADDKEQLRLTERYYLDTPSASYQ